MADGKTPKTIECADHGTVEWKGYICCSNCLAMYDARDDKSPHYAPPICAKCGMKLMPTGPDDDNWTARAVCTLCFENAIKKTEN